MTYREGFGSWFFHNKAMPGQYYGSVGTDDAFDEMNWADRRQRTIFIITEHKFTNEKEKNL